MYWKGCSWVAMIVTCKCSIKELWGKILYCFIYCFLFLRCKMWYNIICENSVDLATNEKKKHAFLYVIIQLIWQQMEKKNILFLELYNLTNLLKRNSHKILNSINIWNPYWMLKKETCECFETEKDSIGL